MHLEDPPRKVPLVFFRTDSGAEPVRDWLRGLDEAGRQANGARPVAGAMAVAGRDAPLPPGGQRFMGNSNWITAKSYGTCIDLPS